MDNTRYVFTCEDSFESIMTCVFYAWELALKVGHDKVELVKKQDASYELFCEYRHIEYDEVAFERVTNGIYYKISPEAYALVYSMSLSDEKDSTQAIINYLRVGFKYGPSSTKMYQNPAVQRAMEIKRRVDNESCHFKEFTRFNSIDNKLYVAHLSPACNVVPEISWYFMDRMPSEYWMIVDDNRHIACVHPKDEDFYIRTLTEVEFNALCETENLSDEYTSMWRTFFNAISIKERENKKCQMNHFPLWMRTHATEFKK